MDKDRPLNPNQLLFIAQYLAALPRNGTAAYMAVYTNADYDTACNRSAQMLKDPRVVAEIQRREAQMLLHLDVKAEDVLREIFLILAADPRELSEHHVGACRYCHGDGHLYQRTPHEYRHALDAHIKARAKEKRPDPLGLEFDHEGGVGFNPYREPHPDCPECFGKGVGFEVFKDTRALSPAASRLFEGVKKTKDGLEIKIRDRSKALDLAASHLGIVRKVEVSGRNGGPIQHAVTPAVALQNVSAADASAVYHALVSGE